MAKTPLTLKALRANVIHLLASVRTLYWYYQERSYVLWSLLLSDYIHQQLLLYGAYLHMRPDNIPEFPLVFF